MKKSLVLLALGLLSAEYTIAQQSAPQPAAALPPVVLPPVVLPPVVLQQRVDVTAINEPLPMAESDRSTRVLLPSEAPAGTDSVVDLLRTDSSLNLEARGGEGVQADLSIRGTTFEQSLILVDGMRVNDPETGHLNLDTPLPFDAIAQVDVLHGSGSTFYGSDAIGGAVNLLTHAPGPGLSVVARSGAGNYGSLEEHLRASGSAGAFAEQISASRDSSDGFAPDRNYTSNAVASESWLKSGLGSTDLLLATSDRPYGANQFYGPYNSWERTKGWMASVEQQLGAKTAASFGYLRHSDLFVLFEGQPAVYENNHLTSSYQAALRRSESLAKNATLFYGLEESGDAIHSLNTYGGFISPALGTHARNQGAGYVSLGLNSLQRLSLSLGSREEILSGGDAVFSPSAAAAYTLTSTLRLRGAAGHGFRLPTYTDLYYADPATVGNANLKPESSWSYEGGLDWRPASGWLTLSATGFALNQANAIDYAKRLPLTTGEPWQAINIPTLNIGGAEAAARLRIRSTERIDLSYTAAHTGNLPAGYQSEYAFNFAAQRAVFAWTGELPGAWGKQIAASTQIEIVQKTTQVAYPLWEAGLARNSGTVRPYLRLTNLSNTGYAEIVGVRAQGRAVVGGVEYRWQSRPVADR